MKETKRISNQGFQQALKQGIIQQLYKDKKITEAAYRTLDNASPFKHKKNKKCK